MAFVFFHEPQIFSYSQNVLSILKKYAKKHSYDIIVFDEPHPLYYDQEDIQQKLDNGVCWHKAMSCIYSLENFDYKQYIWMDADVIITEMDMDLRHWFTHDFVFSSDIWSELAPCRINSGVFFFRDTQHVREIFAKWCDRPKHHKGHNDQNILWEMVRDYSHENKSYLIIDYVHFNAHWQYHVPGKSWCLHMMGAENYIRDYLSRVYKEEIYGLQ